MSKSSNDKRKNTESTPWSGPRPRTERELLELEAATAKSALAQSAKAAARNLFRVADPRAWTEDYPWKSTGIAAVAGFFVAARSGGPPAAKGDAEPTSGTREASGASPWDLVTSLLLSSGTDALKGVLTPWLAQKIQQTLEKRGSDASPPPSQPDPAAETV